MDAATYLRQFGWEQDPFRSPAEFWNRQEELSALQYILSVSQSARVIVHGPPGVGITRLLQQVQETVAGKSFYLVLPAEPERFPGQLWHTVCGSRETPLPASAWDLSEAQLLAQVIGWVTDREGPVPLFLEGLGAWNAKEQDAFLRRYRDSLAAWPSNVVLGCPTEALERLRESPFAALVTDYLPVSPFSVAESRAFLEHQLAPAVEQGHFAQEAVDLMAEASRGNLGWLQEMGKQCLLIGYRQEVCPITREVAVEAIRRALSDQVSTLSEDQRTLLAYLVQQGSASPSDEGFRELLPVSRGRISQLLKDLLEAGFVRRQQAGRRSLYHPTLWAHFV